ncbi:MAG: hypothetical protein Q8941_20120 [Bacteroidota bacterium]|nr:hypothetical protein [Bacteroidota bacterium]
MKKYLPTLFILLLFNSWVSAQSNATDFVAGTNVVFEDHFELDPAGDFPAKWSTSGSGQVVELMRPKGKWLKISQPTAVSPELTEALPENCTIEFDLLLKKVSGVAPVVMFGVTPLSDVSAGDVYRSNIFVKLMSYNEGDNASLVFGKNIDDLGTKKDFPFGSYIERPLHISISLNNTRFRVYLAGQKVVDLPKLLTPQYRGNFFVASSEIIPASEESVYISNIRIASGDVDARSLLIKQLLEQGSAVTNAIQFDNKSGEMTTQSQPVVDQLGQALQQNPSMNIQVNSMEEVPAINGTGDIINKDKLKEKAEKIKAYLVSKFKIKTDRILTDAKVKTATAVDKSKTLSGAKKLLTEFVKL